MKLIKGDFINGSAVVYKKENGFIVKGLQFQDDSIHWLSYWYTGEFHCDRAVIDSGKKMGYINRLGNEIIPPTYSVVDDFSEDRAFVSNGDDTILIDTNGKMIIWFPEAFVTSEFHEGSAILSRIVSSGEEVEEAVVDREGKLLIDFTLKRNINTLTDIHIHAPDSFWHEGIRKFSQNGKLGVQEHFGIELVNDFAEDIKFI